eukprot:Gregarina_sp_Poly_1__312@NODE_1077_length_5170_cov_692_612581_g748_i0_p1_GENE_NODE_1077_length_5170_cov_692_612581_g748_i0NODE_1077_length_5170_cov_692_612581_g748_i0_p1_ORF_typecomplete_len598_score88_39ATF7IP_BD/PF16788_5/1_8e04ATF7IP_BD/PF16788_5/1_8e04ATF7IP_BD/PF16788_5/0_0085ATF7IP_BD/PF16788_5/5_1e03DUF896/PF05979_12/0_26_NODE_1077_length_5170_cov_692_612581_g748_i018113604
MTTPLVGVPRVRMQAERLAQPMEGPTLRGILRAVGPPLNASARVSGTAITESAMAKRVALRKMPTTLSARATQAQPYPRQRQNIISPRSPRYVSSPTHSPRVSATSHSSRRSPLHTKTETHTYTTTTRSPEKVQMYRTPTHRVTQILHPEGAEAIIAPSSSNSPSSRKPAVPSPSSVPPPVSVSPQPLSPRLRSPVSGRPPTETLTFRKKSSSAKRKIVAPSRLQLHPGYLEMKKQSTETPSETTVSLPYQLPPMDPQTPHLFPGHAGNLQASQLPHPFNLYPSVSPYSGMPPSPPRLVTSPSPMVPSPATPSPTPSQIIKHCGDCTEMQRKITELEKKAHTAQLLLDKQKEQVRLQQEYFRSGQAGGISVPAVSGQGAMPIVSMPAISPPGVSQVSHSYPANPVWPPPGGRVRVSRLQSSSCTTSTSSIAPRQPPRRRRRRYQRRHQHRHRHRSLSLTSTSSSSRGPKRLVSVSHRRSSDPSECRCAKHKRRRHKKRQISRVEHVSVPKAPVHRWRMPSFDQVPVPSPAQELEPPTITGESPEEIDKRLENLNYVTSPAERSPPAELPSVGLSQASYTTISNLRPMSKPRRAVCCA